MAAAFEFFQEDAVYRINKKGIIEYGLVIENAEFLSSDDDDSDVPDKDQLKKGHVRVTWHPKGNEEILLERKLHLADRSLMPGDVIRKNGKDKDMQRGYCRTVDVICDVQITGTKQVIRNINSKDLISLQEFNADCTIIYDSWVGVIRDTTEKIIVKFKDGSRCEIRDEDALELEDLRDKREEDSEFAKIDFYPGQHLWGRMQLFENAEWKYCTKEMNTARSKPHKRFRVVIEEVKTTSVSVRWQCTSQADSPPPSGFLDEEKLKKATVLRSFEPCSVQIGDRSFYILKDTDKIEPLHIFQRTANPNYKPLEQSLSNCHLSTSKTKTKKQAETVEEPTIEINIEDDKDWEDTDLEAIEDGSDSASISGQSTSSSTAGSPKKSKTKRGPSLLTKTLKKKKLKRAKKKHPEPLHFKPGDKICVEALNTRSLVDIVWQDGTIQFGVASTTLYPIHHLDDQEFFPGDFVVDSKADTLNVHEYGVVQRVDHSGRTACTQWRKTYTNSSNDLVPEELQEEEVSVYDLKDHPDFKYRPGTIVIRVAGVPDTELQQVGQVQDNYPNGKVLVQWANKSTTFCYPQEIFKVDEYDEHDSDWSDSDSESYESDSWETESERSVIEGESEQEEKTLRAKLSYSIEKARNAMAKLEEAFTQNPNLESNQIMRHLLLVYKDCRALDKLMGTSFFHEKYFEGRLENIRARFRIGSVQKVVEYFSRHFKKNNSEQETAVLEKDSSKTENGSSDNNEVVLKETTIIDGPVETVAETEEPPPKLSETKPTSSPASSCTRLCSLLKTQLLKAHEELTKRYGNQSKVEDMEAEGKSSEDEKGDSELTSQKEENKDIQVDEISLIVTSTHSEGFCVLETAPDCHKFKLSMYRPSDSKSFFQAVKKEMKLLRTSLPAGILVRGFEDRLDLYSVLIEGPVKTPYEDGLFLFDIQLSVDYPKAPPQFHYISYSDRLNPNLYEDGKVCVSLLGTWSGKGTEVWTSKSNLLQVLVSIQGLILVNEPYYNEAGYDKQRDTQQGQENSRMYNEMAVLRLVQSMTKMIINPPETFSQEILDHFRFHGAKLNIRLQKWLEMSESETFMDKTDNNVSVDSLSVSDPNGCESEKSAVKDDSNEESKSSKTSIGADTITPVDSGVASRTSSSSELQVPSKVESSVDAIPIPDFPLLPASKGFCLTLRKVLASFCEALQIVGIPYN